MAGVPVMQPWAPQLAPAYRLGDLVNGQLLMDHLRHPQMQSHPWDHCLRYPTSLACAYVQLVNGTDVAALRWGGARTYEPFCALLWRRLARLATNTTVSRQVAAIHLRLGDVFEEPYYQGFGCSLEALKKRSCRYAYGVAHFSHVPLHNATACYLVGDPACMCRGD